MPSAWVPVQEVAESQPPSKALAAQAQQQPCEQLSNAAGRHSGCKRWCQWHPVLGLHVTRTHFNVVAGPWLQIGRGAALWFEAGERWCHMAAQPFYSITKRLEASKQALTHHACHMASLSQAAAMLHRDVRPSARQNVCTCTSEGSLSLQAQEHPSLLANSKHLHTCHSCTFARAFVPPLHIAKHNTSTACKCNTTSDVVLPLQVTG